MEPRNQCNDIYKTWRVEYRCEYRAFELGEEKDSILHCAGSIVVFAKTIDRAIEMASEQLTHFFGEFEILSASAPA